MNGKVCSKAWEKMLEQEHHGMKIFGSKYPYGLNDRARDENTNKSVGLWLMRILNKSTKSLTIAYFHINVILNTVKKMLKQLAAQI